MALHKHSNVKKRHPHASQGIGSTQQEAKDQYHHIIHKNRQILADMTNKLEVGDDLIDLHDDVQQLSTKLRHKSAEYVTLEALALYSHDENIVELRNQLFFTTKMIYGDLVTEFSREYAENTQDAEVEDYADCTPMSGGDKPLSARALVGLFFDNIYRLTKNARVRKKMLNKLGGR